MNEIILQLEAIPRDDFEFQSRVLTERWKSNGVGMEAIEPILRFMEQYPDIDYGLPGPLVHFIESRDKEGTERALFAQLVSESIERKPTPHTVWIMNRLLVWAYNSRDGQLEMHLLKIMERAKQHPACDAYTEGRIDDFLKYHERRRTVGPDV